MLGGDQGAFNEAYRYVDWLLTVPLLLVEVIAVLALAKEVSSSLISRLVPASAAMIALGYPGEISTDKNTQFSTVFFQQSHSSTFSMYSS